MCPVGPVEWGKAPPGAFAVGTDTLLFRCPGGERLASPAADAGSSRVSARHPAHRPGLVLPPAFPGGNCCGQGHSAWVIGARAGHLGDTQIPKRCPCEHTVPPVPATSTACGLNTGEGSLNWVAGTTSLEQQAWLRRPSSPLRNSQTQDTQLRRPWGQSEGGCVRKTAS